MICTIIVTTTQPTYRGRLRCARVGSGQTQWSVKHPPPPGRRTRAKSQCWGCSPTLHGTKSNVASGARLATLACTARRSDSNHRWRRTTRSQRRLLVSDTPHEVHQRSHEEQQQEHPATAQARRVLRRAAVQRRHLDREQARVVQRVLHVAWLHSIRVAGHFNSCARRHARRLRRALRAAAVCDGHPWRSQQTRNTTPQHASHPVHAAQGTPPHTQVPATTSAMRWSYRCQQRQCPANPSSCRPKNPGWSQQTGTRELRHTGLRRM